MIYIITHKKVNLPTLSNYITLQVGASRNQDLGYIKDNTGDNISDKNPNYCELTGMYWIWRNTSDDYKGIVHYRRFFGKNNYTANVNNIYSYQHLVSCLSQNDAVVSFVEHFKQNAHDEILIECCTEEIFQNMRKAISKLYPEYIPEFDLYFSQNKSVLFNMMFCRGELFDAYCKWLFDVLFELEPHVNLDVLNDYQKRLYGFLGERLMNVWILHNQIKTKNVPVINTEMSYYQKFQGIRRRLTNELYYSTKKMIDNGEKK